MEFYPDIPMERDPDDGKYLVLYHLTKHALDIAKSKIEPKEMITSKDSLFKELAKTYETICSRDFKFDDIKHWSSLSYFYFLGMSTNVNVEKYMEHAMPPFVNQVLIYKIPLKEFRIDGEYYYFVITNNYGFSIIPLSNVRKLKEGLKVSRLHGYSVFLTRKMTPFDFENQSNQKSALVTPMPINNEYITHVYLKLSEAPIVRQLGLLLPNANIVLVDS